MAWEVEHTDEFEAWWNELDRFYDVHVPWADKLYTVHLDELAKEGLIK